MQKNCRKRPRIMAPLVVACLLNILQCASAYEVPLSPEAIHEAYVLGQRNDQATAEFLAAYIHGCSTPEQGCFLTQIELLTPFAQIVDLSQRRATSNYTEQQAADDYRRRGDKIVVQVTLILPEAYAQAAQNPRQDRREGQDDQSSKLRPENFWQNFRFNLRQNGKLIASRSIHSNPVYSAATKDKPSVLDGANVFIEYDAKDVAQQDAVVEVITPEAKAITSTFDLKNLR